MLNQSYMHSDDKENSKKKKKKTYLAFKMQIKERFNSANP